MEGKNNTRLCGMLGFAMRAGKVIIGFDLVCRVIAKAGGGRVALVLVSSEASDPTKKRIKTKCNFYETELSELPLTTEELGALLGKTYAPAVIGICDEGFAREIKLALGGSQIV